MKKFWGIAIVLVLMIGLGAGIACSKDENVINNVSKEYVFSYNNLDYEIGAEFTREKYGQELEYSEVPSCAFEGIDKTYTYEHFEVTTYPDSDKEKIYSVYFLDEEVATKEGLKIGDSLEDMERIYGTGYQKTENMYSYMADKMNLNIIIENGEIISIEYIYKQ